MYEPSPFRLQLTVFAVVSASFANIYITQPVLPLLREEFGTDMVTISFTISAVILGIALSNLPFGYLADRWPIHPILLLGGVLVAFGGGVCAWTHQLYVFIGARFFQGLFIPALTTCLAAYLSKTLPLERLTVVMGAYVSATVVGGLGGRLLGGFIHSPLHWRFAFVTAGVLILAATGTALVTLPRTTTVRSALQDGIGFLGLLGRWDLLRTFICAAGGFGIFSSVFNYLPFRLAAPPFSMPAEHVTLLYLVYIIGIFISPAAGRISNRLGSGKTLTLGSLVLGSSLGILLISRVWTIWIGLLGFCGGFFTVHAGAIGLLNSRLSGGQGRANALYVLFYYLGGWLGITASGLVYGRLGWQGVVFLGWMMLMLPLGVGFIELGQYRGKRG